MNRMNYREIFFTAVMTAGLATLLFGSPQVENRRLEAGTTQVVSVQTSSLGVAN